MISSKEVKTYDNGTYKVSLYEDGTKIMESNTGEFKADFPDSLDIKITDYCNCNCNFCYENSSNTGKHCDSDTLLYKLSQLTEGIEVTLGGGNPLDHPDICKIIKGIHDQGKTVSITVNEKSIDTEKINLLISNGLKSIGISPIPSLNRPIPLSQDKINIPIVYHFICGIHPIEQIKKYLNCGNRILILGFKQVGRGKNISVKLDDYRSELKRIKYEMTSFGKYKESVMSFDNLAITQLDLRTSFTTKDWEKFYLGDDGSCSMYIDAVEGFYCKNSTLSKEKINTTSWNNYKITDYFKKLC